MFLSFVCFANLQKINYTDIQKELEKKKKMYDENNILLKL